ncbi:hypothetical protein PO124_32300 [Bacillus licheniformis]|nr:hypothetical protein [Bacillus licheniformis]
MVFLSQSLLAVKDTTQHTTRYILFAAAIAIVLTTISLSSSQAGLPTRSENAAGCPGLGEREV